MPKITSVMLALALLPLAASPLMAQPSTGDFEVPRLVYKPKQDGSCQISFELENSFGFTIAVSGEAYIVTDDDVTLGSSSVYFAPAVPEGKSTGTAHFYTHSLAGGRCALPFNVKLVIERCRVVDKGDYFRDKYCRRSYSFRIAPS